MGKKKINPSSAISTGIGFIAFGLLFYFTGILTFKSGWERVAISATEEPGRFSVVLFLMLVIGAGLLIWGVVKSMNR